MVKEDNSQERQTAFETAHEKIDRLADPYVASVVRAPIPRNVNSDLADEPIDPPLIRMMALQAARDLLSGNASVIADETYVRILIAGGLFKKTDTPVHWGQKPLTAADVVDEAAKRALLEMEAPIRVAGATKNRPGTAPRSVL